MLIGLGIWTVTPEAFEMWDLIVETQYSSCCSQNMVVEVLFFLIMSKARLQAAPPGPWYLLDDVCALISTNVAT